MHAAVLIAMAIVVAILIYTLVRLGKSDYNLLADRMASKSRGNFEVLKPCPLCHTMLRRGERVHSVVFSGPRSDRGPAESMAHLFGCPYCHPANDDHPRICPVCSKVVPADGYVIARMFEKPGRKHIHVLGCTRCRTRSDRMSQAPQG
jgi:hypothetical protein